jgi:adenylate cyclase
MKPSTKRLLISFVICAFFTVLFAVFFRFRDREPMRPIQNAEYSAQDWLTRYGRTNAADPRLVLIGIDRLTYANAAFFQPDEFEAEPALHMMETNYPWSREVWARLIERLAKAGAKVVAVDLVFAYPGQGDDDLKRVLDQYRDRVVIAYDTVETKTDRGESSSLQFPNDTVITYAEQIHPVEDTRLGYVSIWPDSDGVLRRCYYRQTGDQMRNLLPPNMVLESLAARALEKYGGPELIPGGFEDMLFRYTGPPGFGYRPLPIGTVMSPRLWKANYANGEFFRDKIVLIGPMSELFHDFHTVPFNPVKSRDPQVIAPNQMPGPEIHLNIIGAALHHEFLTEPRLRYQLMIICLLGLAAFVLCVVVQNPLKRLSGLVAFNAGYIALAFAFFNRTSGILLPVATPLLALNFSGITTSAYDYFLEHRDKRRVRRTLERYVSRDVVKELLDNPETFFTVRGGIRRAVTILFCDVRGFTTMTESANESQLVQQLNEYFENWVQTVFEHEGSLDKFIGDAVMAVWGNIPKVSRGESKDAQNAVATALKMKSKLAALNGSWSARGWKEFHIGIGINHGEVIVGEIGSSQKAEITAIGDAVNLASRLEGLTKKYHVDLLLGESMARLVGDTYILRTVALIQVKGKTKAVDAFTVMGDGAAQTVSLPVWLARYEEGVRLYRGRQFAEAAEEFRECLKKQPDDFLSARYLGFCEALMKNPPDDAWTAAEVMTDK